MDVERQKIYPRLLIQVPQLLSIGASICKLDLGYYRLSLKSSDLCLKSFILKASSHKN